MTTVSIDAVADEPRRRYYLEEVASFVEAVLRQQTAEQQAKWAHLPALIRAHPHPFFYASPSDRLVDVVLRGRRAERGA